MTEKPDASCWRQVPVEGTAATMLALNDLPYTDGPGVLRSSVGWTPQSVLPQFHQCVPRVSGAVS